MGESARRARVFDPALGEAVAEAPLASVADVNVAVAAAQVQHEGPVLAPAQVWVGPAAVAAGC